MAGVKDYYKTPNPHDRRASAASSMMERSGLARPFLALATGKELKKAGEYDERTRTAGVAALKDQNDRAWAGEILKHAIKLSESDGVAATKMLQGEIASGKNKHLNKFKDLKFTSETVDDWLTIEGGDGQKMVIHKTALGAKDENGKPLSEEALLENGSLRKFGKVKPDTSAGARTAPKIQKDIESVSKALGGFMDDSLINALIIAGTAPEKQAALQKALQGKSSADAQHIKDLNNSLEKYKKEYKELTGKAWEVAAPEPPPDASDNPIYDPAEAARQRDLRRRKLQGGNGNFPSMDIPR